MTDLEYIGKNMTKPKKVSQGLWSVSFTCRDNYTYSVSEIGTLKEVKKHIQKRLCEMVLASGRPIQ